ncbi:hypothetical protein E2C01_058115 [Portunus trituberculatus]|uniref:Uncharacterized protein n=1 Tax=Portunus trituberculatus TaxID=210409 RepID=A0A5B7H2W2_PORTR|nr:hypothetical protein [Portunus trituberculatus]
MWEEGSDGRVFLAITVHGLFPPSFVLVFPQSHVVCGYISSLPPWTSKTSKWVPMVARDEDYCNRWWCPCLVPHSRPGCNWYDGSSPTPLLLVAPTHATPTSPLSPNDLTSPSVSSSPRTSTPLPPNVIVMQGLVGERPRVLLQSTSSSHSSGPSRTTTITTTITTTSGRVPLTMKYLVSLRVMEGGHSSDAERRVVPGHSGSISSLSPPLNIHPNPRPPPPFPSQSIIILTPSLFLLLFPTNKIERQLSKDGGGGGGGGGGDEPAGQPVRSQLLQAGRSRQTGRQLSTIER